MLKSVCRAFCFHLRNDGPFNSIDEVEENKEQDHDTRTAPFPLVDLAGSSAPASLETTTARSSHPVYLFIIHDLNLFFRFVYPIHPGNIFS